MLKTIRRVYFWFRTREPRSRMTGFAWPWISMSRWHPSLLDNVFAVIEFFKHKNKENWSHSLWSLLKFVNIFPDLPQLFLFCWSNFTDIPSFHPQVLDVHFWKIRLSGLQTSNPSLCPLLPNASGTSLCMCKGWMSFEASLILKLQDSDSHY